MNINQNGSRKNKIIKRLKIEFINLTFAPNIGNFNLENISAVFLIAIKDGMILTARNERGWDIPGGHVNVGDANLFATLIREVDEESGVLINKAKPFAIMNFDGKDKSMLFYFSDSFTLENFIPKEDALERKMMPIKEFIKVYFWKKDVIKAIIDYVSSNNALLSA